MTTEETAQDDSTTTDETALSNLAAALEAKDDITDKGEADEKASEEGSEDKTGEKTSDADNKTAEEEKTGEEEKDAEDGKTTEEESSLNKADEVSELRGILREQKRTISLLSAKQDRVDKRTSKVIDEETGEEKDIEEKLTPLETKMEERAELGNQRGASLEIMLEQMSDTKKWSDVKTVVTDDRVNQIIDTIAAHITKEKGGDLEENRLDTELAIWSTANPYKDMYDLIKEHHPDYIKEEGKEETKETKTDSTEKDKDKKPAKTNASIGDIKGGSEKTGWTAAKIDGMDEMDLRTVPRDVYARYLRGELD